MTTPTASTLELDLSASQQRGRAYRDAYNAELRQLRAQAASDAERDALPQPFCQSVADTFDELVRQFGGYLVRLRSQGLDPARTPFTVSVHAAAQRLGCTRQTVHNHLNRLEAAGMILHRRHRGRHHGSAITLRPSLLRAKRTPLPLDPTERQRLLERLGLGEGATQHQIRLAHDRLRPSTAPCFSPDILDTHWLEVKFLDESEDRYLYDTWKKEGQCGFVSPAAAGLSALAAAAEASDPMDTKQQEVTARQNGSPTPPAATGQGVGRPARAPERSSRDQVSDAGQMVSPRALATAVRLWQLAAPALWPGRTFPDAVTLAVLPHLATWVQRGRPELALTDAHLEAVTAEFRQRIELAQRHLEQHPGAWVVEPAYYFDPANAHGFAGTLKWHKNAQRLTRRLRDARANITWLREAFAQLREAPTLRTLRQLQAQAAERPHTAELTQILTRLSRLAHEPADGHARALAAICDAYRRRQYPAPPTSATTPPEQVAAYAEALADGRRQQAAERSAAHRAARAADQQQGQRARAAHTRRGTTHTLSDLL